MQHHKLHSEEAQRLFTRSGRALAAHEILRELQSAIDQWAGGCEQEASCYFKDRSLGCFGRLGWLRRRCTLLSRDPKFNQGIDVVIFLCTLSLAINCPKWFPEESSGWVFFNVLDIVFAVIFSIELAM